MSFNNIGDAIKSKSREVNPVMSEVAIFKHLINERAHPLDLVRELLSNAGAEEVGATEIGISYTRNKDGHVFDVEDNGCGMDYTEQPLAPGRLDRFLGLGLSGIIGMASDEFSWKGLGSKLAYQSKLVEIETCRGGEYPTYQARVNDPWQTLQQNHVPKPRITEYPSQPHGTKIHVSGHPPHRKEDPLTFEMIRDFLQHRTFAGYTRKRNHEPDITLSVLGRTETLPFGFPEFGGIDFDCFAHEGLKLDEEGRTLYINLEPKSASAMRVRLKGFLTWDRESTGLAAGSYNTGLILSVKGIPYFTLDMKDYGATTIPTARPGVDRTCLVVECDSIQEEMNISRSALVDSAKTMELRAAVAELFERVESSEQYRVFRRIPEEEKVERQGGILAEVKKQIEQADQNWVVFDGGNGNLTVLLREPKNETEVAALIWKLEALHLLPLETFSTLAYIGASGGPDLLAHFQEEKSSEPFRAAVIEIENNFYNYKAHGHVPTQYPKVICWDVPTSGRKARISKTSRPYKFTLSTEEYQVHIYAIKYMDGVKVMTREELKQKGISI